MTFAGVMRINFSSLYSSHTSVCHIVIPTALVVIVIAVVGIAVIPLLLLPLFSGCCCHYCVVATLVNVYSELQVCCV